MRALPFPLLAVLPIGHLLAQATMTGRVIQDSSKAPIAGVEIVLEKANQRAESDTAGRFVLTGVPTGLGYVTIRKIGFRPVRLKTFIFREDTLDVVVRLRPAAEELPPLSVPPAAVRPGRQHVSEPRLRAVRALFGAE